MKYPWLLLLLILLAGAFLISCTEAELMHAVCEDAKQKNNWKTRLFCLVYTPHEEDDDQSHTAEVSPPLSCDATMTLQSGTCVCKGSYPVLGRDKCYASMAGYLNDDAKRYGCGLLVNRADIDRCENRLATTPFMCKIIINDGMREECVKRTSNTLSDCNDLPDSMALMCLAKVIKSTEDCNKVSPRLVQRCKSLTPQQPKLSGEPQNANDCALVDSGYRHTCIIKMGRSIQDCEMEKSEPANYEKCKTAFSDCSYWNNVVMPSFQSDRCAFHKLPPAFDSCHQLQTKEWRNKCMLMRAKTTGDCENINDPQVQQQCLGAFSG